MSKVKILERTELWDPKAAAKSKVHFTPRRRGPEEIKFPIRADKAIMKLTGRPTLAKAKIAYEHYAVARNMDSLGWNKQFATSRAKQELRNILDGDWAFDFFKYHAEQYTNWPRPNFDATAHKQRLLNFLSGLSAK